jgi:hypothetical protein
MPIRVERVYMADGCAASNFSIKLWASGEIEKLASVSGLRFSITIPQKKECSSTIYLGALVRYQPEVDSF